MDVKGVDDRKRSVTNRRLRRRPAHLPLASHLPEHESPDAAMDRGEVPSRRFQHRASSDEFNVAKAPPPPEPGPCRCCALRAFE